MEDGQIKHFLEKAKSDKQLQSELQSATDAQQVVEIAKIVGYPFLWKSSKSSKIKSWKQGRKVFIASSEQCGFKQEEGALAPLPPVT